MRLRNSRVAPGLILLFLCLLNLAVRAQNPDPPQAPPRSSQPAPSQPEATPPAQEAPQGQEPGTDSGGFVFHSDVQEVLLHATVIDDKQHMVTTSTRTLSPYSRMASRKSSSPFVTKTFQSLWAS